MFQVLRQASLGNMLKKTDINEMSPVDAKNSNQCEIHGNSVDTTSPTVKYNSRSISYSGGLFNNFLRRSENKRRVKTELTQKEGKRHTHGGQTLINFPMNCCGVLT